MSSFSYIDKWLSGWVSADSSIAIVKVNADELQDWLSSAVVRDKVWVESQNFQAKPGEFVMLPAEDGSIARVLFGDDPADELAICALATKLPVGNYHIDNLTELIAVGWVLQQYKFDKYKSGYSDLPKLLISGIDINRCSIIASSILFGRELINLPAEDLQPSGLAFEAKSLADKYQANITIISDQSVLAKEFPAVYAVGKAAVAKPQLIDFTWGNQADYSVTLVGKGVCFDSGGLDIKTTAGMATMKKDMGGAAHVLALANMIMALKLPVYLRVIIPAVENAIAGNAYRPGDIVTTRSGKTVEITNTDAEGRMILSDALTYAQEADKCDLIIDVATLTGAARVALGTELPGFFTNQSSLSQELQQQALSVVDPVWELPLYQPYLQLMHSPIADLKNAASGGYGGAITAALFLQSFITTDVAWAHFDLMAANIKSKPAKPEGGEIMGMRAVLAFIESKVS